ncbi:ABC transporter substrate-binding protein [Sansalvadorimonas sp. 2012CJ34-2]|uniref:ABC transporter substrate-binding protein n=1 Tax=Parendozoicomonas callyspongiae TaxID=2942213 RepID=A0ABT0PK14_9GAMM|nr:ABC transporter substrate-binding protein [Sansalvadorimonas sp. 2012CJ34-2]MCL6271730.1 ABC transporter substrate-binding protein [Sansalvadorimonas sp. 2012CJ34-2]
MPVIGMRAANQFIRSLGVTLLLAGCSGPWNDPNEPEKPGETVYYGSYSSRLQHLDPARSYSAEEALFIDQIYESPLRYHFLKRPYVLEPALADSMPSVRYLDKELQSVSAQSPDLAFSLYTITLKPDVFYQPHPAFAQKSDGVPLYLFETKEASQHFKTLSDFPVSGKRLLKAEDFIYGIKRLADPANKSPLLGFLSNYIDGMSEFSQTVKDVPRDQWLDLRKFSLGGINVVDERTFTIRIKGKYPQFLYWLAMHFFAPIPWEADRFYHNPGFQKRNLTLDWHPVGTGAFMMTQNDPNKGITLERNPNYWFDPYPSEGAELDREQGLLEDAGKPMPFIDRATFRLEKESLPQWSKFMQGWYDRSGDDTHNISSDNFDRAFVVSGSGIDLSPDMKQRGINISTEIKPSIYYYGFNMLDPVVGGYSEKKQKLRQAITIAWNMEEFLEIFTNGRGQAAMGPIPPGIPGYKEGKAGINPYIYNWVNGQPERKSIDEAKRLLAEAGYPNGRDAETGKPLVLYLDTTGGSSGPVADWRRRQLENIGVQLEYRTSDYVRFKEKIRDGNTQLFGWGWLADYPDPENFLFLLDSAQTSGNCKCDGNNSTNYENPEFDKLFRQIKVMPDSPQRIALLDKAIDLVRRDNPWIWGYHTKEYYLNNSWVYNTKRHGIAQDTLKYLRIDTKQRRQLQREWNKPVIWPLITIAVICLLIVLPAVIAYRRRQNMRVSSVQERED